MLAGATGAVDGHCCGAAGCADACNPAAGWAGGTALLSSSTISSALCSTAA